MVPNTSIKVSIVTICYNQEAYIRQTLDSFVMQEVEFPFEVIIADDNSSDNTQQIISEYAEKFPKIFKPILRKKNIGIQKNLINALMHADGEYIALCEGDDFWTDSQKLQKQVHFLDTHKDYALCFHPVKVFYENNEERDAIYPSIKNTEEFSLKNLLRGNFIQTNSVMYRKKDYRGLPTNILPLDWYLHVFHAKTGKIGFLDDVMSAYRRHKDGVWWEAHNNADKIWLMHGYAHYAMYCEMQKLFKDNAEYYSIIQSSVYRTFNTLNDVDRKNKTHIIKQVLETYPNSVDPVVVNLCESVNNIVAHADSQAKIIDELSREVKRLVGENSILSDELEKIKKSKHLKIISQYRNYKHKVLKGHIGKR